jgi:hypothetical protein
MMGRFTSNLCGENPPRPKRRMDLCRMDLSEWTCPNTFRKMMSASLYHHNVEDEQNILATGDWWSLREALSKGPRPKCQWRTGQIFAMV